MQLLGRIFLLLTLHISAAYSQTERDGVFVTMDGTNCARELISFTNEKVCIASKPIIPITDFAYITTIRSDLNQKPFFNLVFTPNGYEKIKKISAALPNAAFVLVVENQVIGYIQNIDILNSRVLKIDGGKGSTLELYIVHEVLKSAIPLREN